LFGDVRAGVQRLCRERPDDSKLVESAISGMLAGLDPHSSYMDAKELPRHAGAEPAANSAGSASRSRMEDGLIKVVSPIDDTPGFQAGILRQRHHHQSRR